MKQTSSTKTPVTFDDDAPKLTQADFDSAKLRLAGRDVNRAEWQKGALIYKIRLYRPSILRRQLQISEQNQRRACFCRRTRPSPNSATRPDSRSMPHSDSVGMGVTAPTGCGAALMVTLAVTCGAAL